MSSGWSVLSCTAELYSIYRAAMRYGKRREHDQEYTIFADSQAAIKRCLQTTKARAGDCKGYHPVEQEPREAGNKLRLHHAEIEGKEVADRVAKEEFHGNNESRRFLPRTSMAYLKRQASEAKSRGTKEWIVERTKQRRSYIPPRKSGFRKELKDERKAVASRCYQLLTGHALIAPFLKTSSNRLGPMLVVRDRRKANQRTPLQAL